MAEIMNSETGNKRGKRRAKKQSTHIDMTPMVDLMSLLITFFMLTTAFSKMKVMEIVLPEKPTGSVESEFLKSRTLNVLLTADDRILYYIGQPPQNDEDISTTLTQLADTDYSKDGIRKIVLKMNLELFEKVDSATQKVIKGELDISTDSLQAIVKSLKKDDDFGPLVMIKADSSAKYKNIVDIIDEMAICNVARYAIVDMNEFETKLIEQYPFNY